MPHAVLTFDQSHKIKQFASANKVGRQGGLAAPPWIQPQSDMGLVVRGIP